MTSETLTISLIWAATAAIGAGIMVNLLRRPKAADASARMPFLTAGVVALVASIVPSAIQYATTEGRQFWAGLPLMAVAAYFLVRAVRPQKAASRPAAMTFREKSAAASIIAILAVYGWTTSEVLKAPPTLGGAFGWLLGSTVLMAVVTSISHAALALIRRPETTDERDALVALRATRNAYGALAVGIWGVVGLILVGVSPAILVYSVVGMFVLAELLRLASELVYYRLPV